ncbi:cysteine protease [Pseudozyma hubeiensis SY62]|uniref:Ubiquitin thioesterase OTU n=1 Tax=Pseudozyma hubeiensis (strain SY62) TaxID=1305764 RepID=R9NZV3_PSEHS|nr:cysteine protease [Pseudozyma hubeiensis SY62]GAC94272.1 cysteine protease [Pseudozyma hubeiensis SY62]
MLPTKLSSTAPLVRPSPLCTTTTLLTASMIRIRHPQGTSSFKIDDSTTTLGQLQGYIAEQFGIGASEQELKIGYPPKTLRLSSVGDGALLSSEDVGIKRGEQVIVARKAGSAASTSNGAAQSVATPSLPAQSAISSFGAMGGPKPNISTATGPRTSYGLGARTLQDGLTARAALPSSNPSTPGSVTDGSVSVAIPSSPSSRLTLKVVPDDNSCLFNSVGYLFNQRLGSDVCQNLRQTVATSIRSNPDEYPDIVLGQPRDSYISKILSQTTWGGAIELSILSEHFGVEIDSIDVATGTVHRFGEDKAYENRAIVVYSGIHYDALTLKEGKDETTIFPNLAAIGIAKDEDEVMSAAKQLCQELKRRKYYTDTASFSLKCKTCGTKLTGEKQAVQHAKETGHGDFGEV